MSVRWMGKVFGLPAENITTGERLVLLSLADNADEDGSCWPGHNYTARKTGLSERSVRRQISTLVTKGFLVAHTRFDDSGRQITNLYKLSMPALSDRDTITDIPGGQGVQGEGDTSDQGRGTPVTTPVRTTVNEPSEGNVRTAPNREKPRSAPAFVPDDLENLELYRQDDKLCERWESFRDASETAYPGVDVVAEVAKAHSWEVANPARRKKNRLAFLNNWLTRAQDKAASPPHQNHPVAKDPNAMWGEPGFVDNPNAKPGEPGFIPYDQRKWTI